MNSNQILLWVFFGLCMVLTATTALLFFKKWPYRRDPSFSYLLYYSSLIHVYGFYSLWSAEIIEVLQLSSDVPVLSRILNIMGGPFIILAYGLFILLMAELFAIQVKTKMLLAAYAMVYIFGTIIFTLNLGYPDSFHHLLQFVSLVICFFGSVLMVIKKSSILKYKFQILLSLILLSSMFLFYVSLNPEVVTFVNGMDHFFFFLAQSLFIITVLITGEFTRVGEASASVEEFSTKHNLTKRETEIIKELVLGKSNVEIANSLFITEQTVKDHMSRIYQKTFVKSRVQLVSLIKT